MSETTREAIEQALAGVAHPYLGKDLQTLGMLRSVDIVGPRVGLTLELTSPLCPARDAIRDAVGRAVGALDGVEDVAVETTWQVPSTQTPPPPPVAPGGGLPFMAAGTPPPAPSKPLLVGVKNVIAVASGKGGVGKSTAAVNLALALAEAGARVGLVDADIHGPSVPGMLGVAGVRPGMSGQMIQPVQAACGLKLISMGLLTDADQPAILRGPMVTKFLTQFIFSVDWGELDYLLLDLPPGTGDIHLTLVQTAPVSGGVILTTPQDVALTIARKGLKMFEKVGVEILGIIENMSYFECPGCHARTEIFSHGGGRTTSHELGVPFLGEIPIDPLVVLGGDRGTPIVVSHPDAPAAVAYRRIAGELTAQLAIKAAGSQPFGQFHWDWASGSGQPAWGPEAATDGGPKTIPAGVRQRDDRVLQILWRDGTQHDIDVREIRLDCRCAGCVEEMSGRALLDPAGVSDAIRPVTLSSIGVYAVGIHWSDGHSSGIHSYDSLRQLGDRLAAAQT